MLRMMLEIPIPDKWKQLYYAWDIRVFIILSLFFQMFLILIAPLRKRTKNNWIILSLWCSYLLADCAANFALGLISSSQGNPNENQAQKGGRVGMHHKDLLAFWAPFLLVHLGGPDTITAFALEDNELWPRHLFGLLFQCVVAFYVFIQSLPENRLWIPTMFMFLTGFIKYAEKTRSLFLASANRFKEYMFPTPDPGPMYVKLSIEYHARKKVKLPTRIQMVPEPDTAAKSVIKSIKGNLTELEMVRHAYEFFKTFKGLVVDMILINRRQQNQSRDFFLNRTAKDAFKVIEIELNLIYDVLFTKLPVVFCLTGAISRFLSFATICAAIFLFIFEDKTNFRSFDVMITYILLFGALILDVTALFMLLFSDWTIIYLWKSLHVEIDNKSIKTTIINAFLRLLTDQGTLSDTKEHPQLTRNASQTWGSWITNASQTRKWEIKFLRRRWWEFISTYNLIYYCLHPRPTLNQRFFDKFGLTRFFDGLKYVEYKKVTQKLKDFIFEELKIKSELADDLETTKEISSARGSWVIQLQEDWHSLLTHVVDVDYDQSIIIWHIATEVCYNKELKKEPVGTKNDLRDIAKVLSDYMLYLLIMQPNMMPVIVAGIGQVRFRDTCAEVKRILDIGVDWDQKNACMMILDIPTDVPPVTISGDRSKSLLFDSCILAKELMKLEEDSSQDKWLIISKVWVELLCYGASHARSNTLADQVSKGGELITIVWLLIAHFGLGDQYPINEGKARAKLIVGK
ncbi:unnamed protein product [Lactuca virosa]|uniref:DUF4220 domain-containing protein n=1 Tax=Lactuca virosa TaxID=75947 RepID=A0AAU9NQM7_9ASTR|nr:unnamed protein product [Lactuca virosa]